MKEIKETKTVEEIVAYEATDGTRFRDAEQCKAYEKTAKAVIKTRFMQLIKRKTNIDCLGNVPLVESGSDWIVGIVRLESASDVMSANMWFEIIGSTRKFTDDMIGKDIVVGFDAYDDWAYLYGTIDECVDAYKNALTELATKEEKEN